MTNPGAFGPVPPTTDGEERRCFRLLHAPVLFLAFVLTHNFKNTAPETYLPCERGGVDMDQREPPSWCADNRRGGLWVIQTGTAETDQSEETVELRPVEAPKTRTRGRTRVLFAPVEQLSGLEGK